VEILASLVQRREDVLLSATDVSLMLQRQKHPVVNAYFLCYLVHVHIITAREVGRTLNSVARVLTGIVGLIAGDVQCSSGR
jgi:hypothetical protein